MTSQPSGAAARPLAYRVKGATEASGLSRTTLYEAMAAGDLEFYFVGRSRLIPADALDAFLGKHRRQHQEHADDANTLASLP